MSRMKEVVVVSRTVNMDMKAKNMPPKSINASGWSIAYSKAASSLSRIAVAVYVWCCWLLALPYRVADLKPIEPFTKK